MVAERKKMDVPRIVGLSIEKIHDRRLGIGGSDMPIILGLSSYKTCYKLYLEKLGLLPIETKMSEAQEFGHRLEPIIRDKFADKNNVLIETPDTMIHPFYSFMRGNIDGYIVNWHANLEIKSSGNIAEWGEEETDHMPLAYLVQIAYYCAIMNVNNSYLAVLIGHYGFKYRQYKYTRDLELEKMIIQSCCAFWQAIQNEQPPPPVNQIDLRMMFPKHDPGKSINVSNDINKYLNNLMDVKKKMKELQEIEDESRFNIMQHMKDAECLVDDEGRPLITWRANKSGSRTFLLKGEK